MAGTSLSFISGGTIILLAAVQITIFYWITLILFVQCNQRWGSFKDTGSSDTCSAGWSLYWVFKPKVKDGMG